MKTLIINGSPRKNGNTTFLLKQFKKELEGEIIELSAYELKVNPCTDCRYCWKNRECKIKDTMQEVYELLESGIDNIVIASPIYDSNFPGPLVNINNRLQVYYAAKKILKQPILTAKKQGALILVGGGSGGIEGTVRSATDLFGKAKASYDEDNLVRSLNTDDIPAHDDFEAVKGVKRLAIKLNGVNRSN